MHVHGIALFGCGAAAGGAVVWFLKGRLLAEIASVHDKLDRLLSRL